MRQKRSGLPLFLIIGIGFLLFFAIAGYLLLSRLNNTTFSLPEINILKPSGPQAIPLGDGLLLATYARSDCGLHRVEFYMDQELISQKIPPEESAQELLAQFTWLPQTIGAYDLSFIAYDTKNNPSERASIPVAVIAPNLPDQVAHKIQQDFALLPVQNIAGSDSDPGSQDGAEGLDGADGQDGIDEGIFDDDQVIVDDQQDQPPNTPPFINVFDVHMDREGSPAVAHVYATAKDDTGLFVLQVKVFSEGDFVEIDSASTDCDGDLTCDLSAQFSLAEGAYSISAIAQDINGVSSAPLVKNVEADPNDAVQEPWVLVQENQQFAIPDSILEGAFIGDNNRIHLPPQFSGGGRVEPFEEIDPQIECPPFCPPVSIDDVEISVEQSWKANRWLEAQVTLSVPPDFVIEDLDEPGIAVYLREDNSNRGNCPIGLSPELRHINGEHTTCRFDLIGTNFCGGNLNFYPKIFDGAEPKSEGNGTIIQALPCPPPKPELTQLHATTNCGGAEKCIIVSWNLPESQDNSYSADHLVLTRKYPDLINLDTREDEFTISIDQTSFVDADPFDYRYYEYFLKSVSTDGVESNESRMNIRTPRHTDVWEVITTDWQDSR